MSPQKVIKAFLYCPYGLQKQAISVILKGIFNHSQDISIVPFINWTFRSKIHL